NRVALRSALEAKLSTRPAQEWIDAFTTANIPAGRVNTIGQAFDLAESLGLGTIARTEATAPDGSSQTLSSVALPISLSRTPATYQAPPPNVGEHQDAKWRDR